MAKIDKARRLKRLLGEPGFGFLEHALDAPMRLLPQVEQL